MFGLGKFLNLIFFLIAQAHRIHLGSVWSLSTRTLGVGVALGSFGFLPELFAKCWVNFLRHDRFPSH